MDPVAGPSRIPDQGFCHCQPASASASLSPPPPPPRSPREYHDGEAGCGVRADECGSHHPHESWETGRHNDAGRPCPRREHSCRRIGKGTTAAATTTRRSKRRGGMPATASGRLGFALLSASPYILVAPHLFEAASAAPSWQGEPKGKGRAFDDDRDSIIGGRHVLSSGRVMVEASSPPTRTLSPPSKRQIGGAAAYSSGIIADWTHQSRSVWFQRKAIIITSCFLAIFIVLIIGATVFLRDRRDENDLDDDDDDEFSDEAALRRMREERDMRSGDRAKKKKDKKQREKDEDDEKEQRGSASPSRKGRRKVDGSGSGNSTALSKRLVSRWIRASPAMARSASGTTAVGSSPEPAASRRSSESSSLRRATSRASRLGGPRSDRVEVRYEDGTTVEPTSSREAGASTSSPSVQPSSSPSTHPLDQADRSGLDESDLQAADEAEEINQPPAYIHGPPTSPPPPPPPPPASQPTYQRPLAGEFTGDSKGRSSGSSPGPSHAQVPPHVLAGLRRQDESTSPSGAANADGEAHLATDDKARLAALAAAASSPGSAPRSGAGGSATAAHTSTSPDAQGPSAPDFDLDQDGFEASAHHSETSQSYPDEKAKGKARDAEAGSGFLPAPPSAHAQQFSPFDQPYHRATLREPPSRSRSASTTTTQASPRNSTIPAPASPRHDVDSQAASQPSVPLEVPTISGRAAEKQREAEAELAFVASSPAAYAGRRDSGRETLPAYHGREEAQQPSAPALEEYDAPATAPSMPHEDNSVHAHTPSAPPADDDDDA